MRISQSTLSSRLQLLALGLVLIVCMVYLLALCACGQEEKATIIELPRKSLFDAKKAIDLLENHNSVPLLVPYGEGCSPLFDEKYNWAEYERVVEGIRFLKCHVEEAWPEILSHFGDERYCTSVASEEFERGWNYTVGRVCQEIVRNYITAAYDRHLYVLEAGEFDYRAICSPEMLRKAQDLKAWCELRRNKRLFELQVEMCDWAMTYSATIDVTSQRREAFVNALRAEIKAIDHSGVAVGCRWFNSGPRPSSVWPYNCEIAERIREYWRKTKTIKGAPIPKEHLPIICGFDKMVATW